MSQTHKPQVVILFLLQGRPLIISDDDGEPHAFASMEAAREFANQPHMGIDAASDVYILDMATGELDSF